MIPLMLDDSMLSSDPPHYACNGRTAAEHMSALQLSPESSATLIDGADINLDLKFDESNSGEMV